MTKHDALAEVLSALKAEYQRTLNPLYLWRAILLSEGTGEIPQWCRERLFDWAAEIDALAQFDRSEPGDKVRSVIRILGFDQQGSNAFKLYDSDAEAQRVADFIDRAKLKSTPAVRELLDRLARNTIDPSAEHHRDIILAAADPAKAMQQHDKPFAADLGIRVGRSLKWVYSVLARAPRKKS